MLNTLKRIFAAAIPSAPTVSTIPTTQTVSTSFSIPTVVPTLVPSRAPTAGPTISIVNISTILTDAQILPVVAAIQVQVDRDFAPAWGMPANLVFVPKGQTPAPTSWVVRVMDTSDQPGALGYHDMTAANMPEGKIFVADDKKYGLSWSVTLSHEILEMLGDPYINNTIFIQETATTGKLFAFEMCDSVEDDTMGYTVNSILVSNFVLPAFYESNRAPGSTKFDYRGVLKAPLSIAQGGYMSVFEISPTTKGWSQQHGAEGVGARLAAKLTTSESRIARRTFGKI